MRDATYVMIALVLCMIASVFVVHMVQQPSRRSMSLFELEEFVHLPLEIRSTLRRLLFPDAMLSRQRWAALDPNQKQAVLNHMVSAFETRFKPSPPPSTIEELPELVPPPPPTPEPEPEPETPHVEDEGLKKGFLLTESKKTHPKNKKKNKSETLVHIVATPEEPTSSPGVNDGRDGFLNVDQ
mgnify:CR=1 FL=1